MAAFLDNDIENSPMVWTEIELSHNKPVMKQDTSDSVSKPGLSTEQAHMALSSSTTSTPRSPLSEISNDVGTASLDSGNYRISRTTLVTPTVTANLVFDTNPRVSAESEVKDVPETPGMGNADVSDLQSGATATAMPMSLAASPENPPEVEDGVDGEESEAETESDEARVQREMEESERLCWEMMQQESMEAYNMQVGYMREHAEDMSEEDRAALEMILQQESQPLMAPGAGSEGRVEGEHDDDDEEGEDTEEEAQGGLDENSENWSYDQLLALGEAIGDVKTEKWKIRAFNVIKTLPRLSYGEMCDKIAAQHQAKEDKEKAVVFRLAALERGEVPSPAKSLIPSSSNAHAFTSTGTPLAVVDSVSAESAAVVLVQETNCAICRDEYESSSSVLNLPCGHYFHDDCCVGWLNSNNSCPMCKTKVTLSP